VTPWLGLAAVAAVGSLQSLGSAINGSVGRELGVVRATCLFLAVGSVWAFALSYALEGGLSLAGLREIPPYLFIPGLVNLVFIATMIRIINVLGVMLTQGGIFAGQMIASLILDHIGFAGLQRLPATPGRIVGVAALLVGVGLLASASFQPRRRPEAGGAEPPGPGSKYLWTVVAALVLGSAISTAMVLNARLGALIGPFASTGLFLLPGAVFLAVYLLVRRRLQPDPARGTSFSWLYLVPGSLNVAGVGGSIIFIPVIGAQLMTATTFTAGVFTGLLLIDRLGMFGLPRHPVTARRLTGAAVLVCGVLISTLFRGA